MSEEELFPKITSFDDGSAIIAYSLSNEKFIVTHGEDKYSIKSIFVSNYAQEGGTIKTEPSNCIVVEHPINAEGKSELTPENLQDYVVEFVRAIRCGNFDKDKICHYIGRRDDKIDNMIISPKVKREVVDKILEPDLEKRKMDRNYEFRAELLASLKKQNEK